MQPGISTHVLLQQRLQTAHLDAFARAGARHIELFAARHHFDYTDRSAVRDIAAWFRSSEVNPTLHQPLYLDDRWTRHTAPNLNLISLFKPQRIEAGDEVKRLPRVRMDRYLISEIREKGLSYLPTSLIICPVESMYEFGVTYGCQSDLFIADSDG